MGVNYLFVSGLCTAVSFAGLQWWMSVEFERLKTGVFAEDDGIHAGNAGHALELLLGSWVMIGLLANLALNVFVLVVLCLKAIFFGPLYPSETRKVLERVVNYAIYKGTFLPLVVPSNVLQAAMWSTWLIVLCFMKMFQALARDRLDRLNASPSATSWMYFRVFSVLLFVLSVDILWIRLCMIVYGALNTTMFLLLFFEPLSIAFETLQGIMVYGVQLLEMWHRQSVESKPDCKGSKLFDKSAAGFLSEIKGILIRNFGFFLDLMTLLMAFGHYLLIWWLHGMAFHLIDAVLFLNLRALVATIVKRIRGYVKLKKALSLLDGVLPDATHEELHAYDDECAICREPMSRAKRLCCNHLFHLACLRSWLDQGLNGVYSCPTCRRPLFPSSQPEQVNSGAREIVNDGQLGMQRRPGLDLHTMAANAVPEGVFPGQQGNPSDPSTWRGVGFDASLVPPWSNPAGDGAGPSNGMRPAGVGRLQMMMRHLASVSESYAHNTLEDTSWNLWPAWHGQPSSAPVRQRQDLNPGGIRFRSTSPSTNENLAGLLAMADTVREVLPHIPDDLIFQDLRRTNNVAVTVNNLLQLR